MNNPFDDVALAPESVINQLGEELGQLSVLLVQARLKLKAALFELNRVNTENEGLRERVKAFTSDMAALREQVAAKRRK